MKGIQNDWNVSRDCNSIGIAIRLPVLFIQFDCQFKEPFTYSNTTDEEADEILSYLIKRYSKFLNFKNPVGISWGDYNFYNEFGREYEVYDASVSDLEKIINYNFCRADFLPNEKGELMYRMGSLEEVYLPYYRFYVRNPELDDDNEEAHRNGLKTYGAYYVPALEERHILNMPIYDGRFH